MRELDRSRPRPTGRRALFDYLSSGILALLLALAVWVMAVYEQDPPKTDYFDGIAIKYENAAPGLVLVGDVEERVRVEMRAPTSRWSTLTPASIEASVDLSGLDVGVHTVDVNVRPLDKTAQVIKLTPARVVVRLEKSVRRQLPVTTEVADADSVPPGYKATAPQVAPALVTLSGPSSLVESVAQVVARVWLRGSKTPIENQVVPVALDAQGEQVDGVDLSPRTVTVSLGVTALADFRDITVRAAIKGVPAAGYWVSNIVVEPAAVTIQGKAEVLGAMEAVVATEPIDITGVKDSLSKRVALALPEGVSVYSPDASAQTVLVRIEVTPIVGGKTVQPTIEVQGLRAGFTASISPDTVDVILSGPMPDLQALAPGDVHVVVNLYGLKAGRHMVPPTVLLPEGSSLKVESISPDAVEVNITTSAGGAP